ncbi:hypothetical protein [Paracoccus sp. (in: a-proteobacteria)]|uniref:hypothetical protein n=1 Tax=Paracoccus sp. TaxID=267 RepID=UPI002AFFB552|nr:hypothetical protein [Paracoccus sp. (in: a-proteobacteria)]
MTRRVEAVTNASQARDLKSAWHDASRDSRDAAKAVTEAAADLDRMTKARQDAAQTLGTAKAGAVPLQRVQADLTRLEATETQVGQAAHLQAAFGNTARTDGTSKKRLAGAEDASERLALGGMRPIWSSTRRAKPAWIAAR